MQTGELEILQRKMLANIEAELKSCIDIPHLRNQKILHEMLSYQMGWASGQPEGKRIRPLLVLLTTFTFIDNWQKALPVAAALELIHNYSLIHDDIEDRSLLRRGKDTMWVRWGEAQAINTGDCMLNLALQAPWRMENKGNGQMVAAVVKTLQKRSVDLTLGQFMDIAFEEQNQVGISEYFEMVEGKTSSLLKAALEMGGIVGGASETDIDLLEVCGSLLGRAYQIQDDWLGIWGNEALTGKSTQSDLRERKKSFPIIIGLSNDQDFARTWNETDVITPDAVKELARWLEVEGVKEKCELEFNRLFHLTLESFSKLSCGQDRAELLIEFVGMLLKRRS
jgi:geranylgeranyl diphosphate synthase, type I